MTTDTPKLLADRWTRMKVAAAGLTILVIGSWSAPTGRQLPTSEERVAPLLEAEVQRREDRTTAIDWRAAVDKFRSWGLELRPQATPATIGDPEMAASRLAFALPVSTRHAVTHQRALLGERPLVIAAGSSGGWTTAGVAAVHLASGLVLLQTAADLPGAAQVAPARAATGDSLVAVSETAGARIVVPAVITAVIDDEYRLASGDDSLDIGMPLYTAAGEAVAIYAGFGRARPIGDVLGELTRDAATGVLPASIGVTLQPITSELEKVLGATSGGVIVARVVPGGPAAAAGLVEGDIVLTLGDEAIDADNVMQQVRQLRIGVPIRVAGTRNRRPMTFSVTPQPWTLIASLPVEGTAPRAFELFDRQQLADASIPGQARVITIDRRPVRNAADARRLLSTRRTSLVHFELGRERFFAALGGGQ